MKNAEEVFQEISAALGSRVERVPDGETGERRDWITWLEPMFDQNPALRKSGEFSRVHDNGTGAGAVRSQAALPTAGSAFRETILCRCCEGILRGVQSG
jgi:hypothetical protein